MENQKQHRHPKHPKSKPAAPALTPEQREAALAAKAVAEAAAKLEQERIQRYENSLPKMSFRQLRGELRRNAKRPVDTSFLTSGIAAVLLTVLENTKTAENPFGKLSEYPR